MTEKLLKKIQTKIQELDKHLNEIKTACGNNTMWFIRCYAEEYWIAESMRNKLMLIVDDIKTTEIEDIYKFLDDTKYSYMESMLSQPLMESSSSAMYRITSLWENEAYRKLYQFFGSIYL